MNSLLKTVALNVLTAAGMILAGVPFSASSVRAANPYAHALCQQNSPLCTEVADSLNVNGYYTGHDEPSLLFYSSTSGSGNNNVYYLQLPQDPPTLPKQDGTGGTFNFQLHPAFWFGMALCDDQSAPNPGGSSVAGRTIHCKPDSDDNIYENGSTSSAHYIGKHPGTAFMEMQFYPPGWVSWPAGVSCDPYKWCAALNIDSLSENYNTLQLNNNTCLNSVGVEPVNFAFITKTGVAHAPANPVSWTADPALAALTPNPATDLFMNSGDRLVVSLRDTPDGFEVVIVDLTTGQSGSMKASVANGFGAVKFNPAGTTCDNIPTAFHPEYATSSEKTRVVWAAHSYNVAFADEIGHFEYCAKDDGAGGCATAGVTDPLGVDVDDNGCFGADDSLRVQIAGCIGTDADFDGPEYFNNWPGTLTDHRADRRLHATAITFSSPLFRPKGGRRLLNYSRVAFEADLPRIEASSVSTNNVCNRTTGAGCVNPPNGASFYPIFTTRDGNEGFGCLWQLGGAYIPDTTDTFGGTSASEYGPLLLLTYPGGATSTQRYNDFRQVLSVNPCPAGGDD
jgi:hypothetical protein